MSNYESQALTFPNEPKYDASAEGRTLNADFPLSASEYFNSKILEIPKDILETEDAILLQCAYASTTAHVFVYAGNINIKQGEELFKKPIKHLEADPRGGVDAVVFLQEYSFRCSLSHEKECGGVSEGQLSDPVKFAGNSGSVTVSTVDNALQVKLGSPGEQLKDFVFKIYLKKINPQQMVSCFIYDGDKVIWSESVTGQTKCVDAYLPETYTAILVAEAVGLETSKPELSQLKSRWVAIESSKRITLGTTLAAVVDDESESRQILKAYKTNKLLNNI